MQAVGELSYRERTPGDRLAQVVTCVWVQRVAADAPAYRRRTVPNGSVELYAELAAGRDAVPQIAGPQTGPRVQTLPPGTTLVGVRFHPGAAPAVLGVPAVELVDQQLALAELWGRAGAALADRISEAGSPGRAAAVLADAVRAGRERGPEPDPLVAEVVGRLRPAPAGGPVRAGVGDLASDLWISVRQLRRRSIAATGYGPKTLHRLLRFQGFLALVQTGAEPVRGERGAGLARVAAAAGYADQAHLTRECGWLAGLPPRAFLAELADHCRGRHDHAASFAPVLDALAPARGSAGN